MSRPSVPRWALAAMILVVLSGLFARAPVVNALTGVAASDARLFLSPSYLMLAPFGAVLDQLSLLTDRQHVAVLVGLLVVFLAWRAVRRLSGATRGGLGREVLLAGGAFATVLAVYGFGVLGPRPMAALSVSDPDLVIVDFHSHTEASHDGRPGLDPRERRVWHDRAGFHLVYVTDHATIDGALEAEAENPAWAGDGISLVTGREVRYRDQHVIVLGPTDPLELETGGGVWPVLIQTLPNDLSRVPVPHAAGRAHGGVHAIELVDADPRGLRQSVEERARILAIADSLDLALVAGSNHHGWGRAAAAWNLMRIPGWQTWEPNELARAIEERIRRDRASANVVLERPRLAGGVVGAPLLTEATTLPRFVWHTLVSLTAWERVAWLVWILLASVLLAIHRERQAAQAATTIEEPELELLFH